MIKYLEICLTPLVEAGGKAAINIHETESTIHDSEPTSAPTSTPVILGFKF
jgi:hypothetical protein